MNNYLVMVKNDRGMVVGVGPELTLTWGDGMTMVDVEKIARSNADVAAWLPAIKKLQSIEMIGTRPVTHTKTGNRYKVLEVDVINATNTVISDGTRVVLYKNEEEYFVRESKEFGNKFEELEELDK